MGLESGGSGTDGRRNRSTKKEESDSNMVEIMNEGRDRGEDVSGS
jgi:hypothetical protein